MAFSDLLNDPENKIRVLPAVEPANNMATGINAVAGIAGAFISDMKQQSDAAFRDKLVGDLQREFLTTTEAYKQGKITEREMNLRMDTRLRQVRADNPWRAADIDKWVKEDLGLQPRGNTAATEIQQAKQQAEMDEAMFRKSMETGIVMYTPEGTVDRRGTIRRFQDVNLAQLQMQFAAKQGDSNSPEQREARKLDYTEKVRGFYQQAVTPAMATLYTSLKDVDMTDVDRISAARERAVALKAQLSQVIEGAATGTYIDQKDVDAVVQAHLERFDRDFNFIFAVNEEGANWGVVGQRVRALENLQASYGVQAGEALAPIKDALDLLGPQAKDSLFTSTLITGKKPTTPTGQAIDNSFQQLMNLTSSTQATAEIVGGRTKPEDMPVQRRVEALPNVYSVMDNLVKTPNKLGDADLSDLSRSVNGGAVMVNDVTNIDPKNRSNFIKRVSKNDVFNRLNEALNNSKSAEDARTALSNLRITARDELLFNRDALIKQGDQSTLTGIAFNPDTGRVQLNQEMRTPERRDGLQGSGVVNAIGGLALNVVNRLERGSANQEIERFNNALATYSKAAGLLSNRNEMEFRKEVAATLGLPTTRPMGTVNVSDEVRGEVNPIAPTKVIRKRFVDGKLVDVTE